MNRIVAVIVLILAINFFYEISLVVEENPINLSQITSVNN